MIRNRRRWAAAVLLGFAWLGAHDGQAQDVAVDLELALAVDGSRSIDQAEFDLQIQGIATAFRDPEFLGVLRSAAPRGIAVTMVQWAGFDDQAQVVGWQHVSDAPSAATFGDAVLAAGRRLEPGPTGIGSAIRYSVGLIATNSFKGTRRVIDISGDGYNNSGNRPEIARDEALAVGVTINGLTVLNEVAGLDRYFTSRVIGGPGAFVIEALNFEAFAAAFKLKLIREITDNNMAWSQPAIPVASD